MISFSEMGYLIILIMKPVHVFCQNKNMTIYMNVGKGETHHRKKNVNENVKRNTKNDRNGQMV